MKKTKILACMMAICCTALLAGCEGTNKENAENEIQQETNANPGAQNESETAGQHASGAQINGSNVDATKLNSAIGGHEMLPSQSIVENISSNPKLSTMASVLRKADLVKDLTGTGPYTIFAPTNDAFDALPAGTIEDLMKPENKERLVAILRNHVVAGKTSAADLQNGNTLKTMADAPLQIEKKMDQVMISGAEIEQPDNMSSNGVIHIINTVLLPAAK